jgi:hypothetical protein
MTSSKETRTLRFSLRTALLLTAVVAALVGLAVFPLTWIRQRAAWRAPDSGAMFSTQPAEAPWLLALYGEKGESWIELKNGAEDQLAELRRLFPEAEVVRLEQQPVAKPPVVAPVAPIAPRTAPKGAAPPPSRSG